MCTVTTYEQTTSTGKIRTMYMATVGKTTYHAESMERLNELIKTHVLHKEGTF